MIFLAITPKGLEDALSIARKSGAQVWCGADAISEDKYRETTGGHLSRFNYELGARDREVIEDALDTINEHHPDETVWVEAVSSDADAIDR